MPRFFVRAATLRRRAPATDPRSPSTSSVDEPENDQKQHGTDRGIDDGGDDAGAKVNSQLRQQPAANEGADDPNDDISDDSEAGALYDLPGKPSSREADDQNNDETFSRHMHPRFLSLKRWISLELRKLNCAILRRGESRCSRLEITESEITNGFYIAAPLIQWGLSQKYELNSGSARLWHRLGPGYVHQRS